MLEGVLILWFPCNFKLHSCGGGGGVCVGRPVLSVSSAADSGGGGTKQGSWFFSEACTWPAPRDLRSVAFPGWLMPSSICGQIRERSCVHTEIQLGAMDERDNRKDFLTGGA